MEIETGIGNPSARTLGLIVDETGFGQSPKECWLHFMYSTNLLSL